MTRRVLMIAHTFPPLGSVGGSVRLLSFLKYMGSVSQDWEATVLTVGDDRDLLLLNRNSGFALESIPTTVRVLRSRTLEPYAPRMSQVRLARLARRLKLLVWRPLLNLFAIPDDAILWRPGLLNAAAEELATADYSVIYATAPPFSVLYCAALLSRRTGIPLVLDIKDDWVTAERYRGRCLLRQHIERRMERACFAAASRVLAVTDVSMQSYRERYPEYAHRIGCIPNGCDIDEFRPAWDAPPDKYSKFTIIHSGVIGGRIRDASGLLRAISRLFEREPEAKGTTEFLVFGRIDREQSAVIRECGLEQVVRCHEFVDRGPYVEMLCRSHLPVAVNVGVPQGTIPGKLYEYWASRNRQLLLESPDSAAARLVLQHGIGDVVDPFDVDSIADVLHRAWLDYRAGTITPVDTSGLVAFDRKALTRELVEVLDEVAGTSQEQGIPGKVTEGA